MHKDCVALHCLRRPKFVTLIAQNVCKSLNSELCAENLSEGYRVAINDGVNGCKYSIHYLLSILNNKIVCHVLILQLVLRILYCTRLQLSTACQIVAYHHSLGNIK